MPYILADIVTLEHYLRLYQQHKLSFPKQCLHCGKAGLWLHGHYDRKADRSIHPGETLNPVAIQRFYCPDCKRTCSALPECIPPRRWYLWAIQQMVLLLWLSGKSFYATTKEIAKVATPSRHTIKRWLYRLQERFHLHKDTLRQSVFVLGRTPDFSAFWQVCLRTLSLGTAMRLCHVSGVAIP